MDDEAGSPIGGAAAADPAAADPGLLRRSTDVAIRLAVLAALAYWCFAIFRPFLIPFVVGVVLAVALFPLHLVLERLVGGRRKLAATLVVLACVGALLVPVVVLSGSAIEGARMVSARVHADDFSIPLPSDQVATWPVIGKPVHELWTKVATDFEALVPALKPQLKALGLGLVGIARQGAGAVLLLLVALAFAGFLWVKREPAAALAVAVARRLGGERGASLVALSEQAVRAVAKGVVGVALIQAGLAGIGLYLAGVPGAGLWAMLVMILAVAQLPALLVLGPAILYVLAASDSTFTVVAFGIWSVAVSLSDAILKPLLMGRGSSIPTAVILIGAIGGLILHGLIGLFVGAVVLSMFHALVSQWLGEREPAAGSQA